MKHLFWYITCWLYLTVQGQWVNDTKRKRINEEALSHTWGSIELPLDHFNVLDNRTYKARYMTNDQFYKEGGPVIIYVGGEWEIEDYGVKGGVAFQLAKRFNGYLFYPEHRYFGKSLPFPQPFTDEKLQYLTPDNSIADLVYSISHIKGTVKGLENSQTILVGGSYAGTIATWARLKYPHIISMSYVCGEVIEVSLEDTEYLDVVYMQYKKLSPSCLDIIVAATHEAREIRESKGGFDKLMQMFPYDKKFLCTAPDHRFLFEEQIFNAFKPQVWAVYKLKQICHYMLQNTSGSPLERLSQVINVTMGPDNLGNCEDEIMEQWNFMVCTFMGNVPVGGESNFKGMFNLNYQLNKMCPQFTRSFIEKHIYRTTKFFGGKYTDVRRVLSIQGTYDPWRSQSIMDDLNDETPVVYIRGATHCAELGEEQVDETPQVAQAKIEILDQLSQWIL